MGQGKWDKGDGSLSHLTRHNRIHHAAPQGRAITHGTGDGLGEEKELALWKDEYN